MLRDFIPVQSHFDITNTAISNNLFSPFPLKISWDLRDYINGPWRSQGRGQLLHLLHTSYANGADQTANIAYDSPPLLLQLTVT